MQRKVAIPLSLTDDGSLTPQILCKDKYASCCTLRGQTYINDMVCGGASSSKQINHDLLIRKQCRRSDRDPPGFGVGGRRRDQSATSAGETDILMQDAPLRLEVNGHQVTLNTLHRNDVPVLQNVLCLRLTPNSPLCGTTYGCVLKYSAA